MVRFVLSLAVLIVMVALLTYALFGHCRWITTPILGEQGQVIGMVYENPCYKR